MEGSLGINKKMIPNKKSIYWKIYFLTAFEVTFRRIFITSSGSLKEHEGEKILRNLGLKAVKQKKEHLPINSNLFIPGLPSIK